VTPFRPEKVPGVHPRRVDSLGVQEGGSERGREQFAHRHDPRANAVAHLPSLGDGFRHALQFVQEALELRARNQPQVPRQIAMTLLDPPEDRLMAAGYSGR
jgi:hypothetical protein